MSTYWGMGISESCQRSYTAQKKKFPIKDFFSNLLKKSLMENFIYCAV